MNRLGGPFAASLAGHAGLILLLLMLPAIMSAPPKIDLTNAVEVVFAPAPPQPIVAQPIAPPIATQPPIPPIVEQPPPSPEAAQAELPSPPPKPALKPQPRPVKPVDRPRPEMASPLPTAPAAVPQTASLPPPVQAPVISADYRAMLTNWLESHKRYPEEARQRGEEGRAVLRFRVDRNGRVLDYTVVSSTGYSDLDAGLGLMMRGATLPPFPPNMTSPEIEVSVTIRFGLTR
jgi:periplasmic protein TonB